MLTVPDAGEEWQGLSLCQMVVVCMGTDSNHLPRASRILHSTAIAMPSPPLLPHSRLGIEHRKPSS